MTYVLENLQVDGAGTLRCTPCTAPVGPAEVGYRDLAGTFDLPLSVGQSEMIAGKSSAYVLRHYACRSCGSLFDVEMLARDDAPALRQNS